MKDYIFAPIIHFKETIRVFIVALLIGVFVVVAFVAKGVTWRDLLLILGITAAGVAVIVIGMCLLKSIGLYLINGKLYSGVKIFKKQIDIEKIVAVKKVPSASAAFKWRSNIPGKYSMVFLSSISEKIVESKESDSWFSFKKYTVCYATYNQEFIDLIVGLKPDIVFVDLK